MVAITDDASARSIYKIYKTIQCVVFVFIAAMGISACSTGGSLINGFNLQSDEAVSTNELKTGDIPTSSVGSIAIAPLIGPPDEVSNSLTSEIKAALARQSIQSVPAELAQASAAASNTHTLRGYVVAASEAGSIKISYIWDIADAAGKRVHRIAGEEVVRGAASSNPWASVDRQTIAKMANATAASVAQWLPKVQSSAASVSSMQDNRTLAAGQEGSAKKILASVNSAGSQAKDAATVSSGMAVYVPNVNGAPGDGSTSLSLALQKELQKSGLKLVKNAGATAHTVEGQVAVGAASEGQQPIKIDWIVKAPNGTKIGTVSQKNQIPAGSLDGQWGATAAAAASAAAQGIIRLLPSQTDMRS